jgi:hypothetical protein
VGALPALVLRLVTVLAKYLIVVAREMEQPKQLAPKPAGKKGKQ